MPLFIFALFSWKIKRKNVYSNTIIDDKLSNLKGRGASTVELQRGGNKFRSRGEPMCSPAIRHFHRPELKSGDAHRNPKGH